MATGFSNQLTKQVGEYLVAAELCRRGLIATTFTGNVPDYDIVAINEKGEDFLIQVKSIWGGSWQFGDVRKFLNVKLEGRKQITGKTTRPKYTNLIYVFVRLDRQGNDRFFVIKAAAFHQLMAKGYRGYIKKKEGIRPKKYDSFHGGLKEHRLAEHKDKWDLITGPSLTTG